MNFDVVELGSSVVIACVVGIAFLVVDVVVRAHFGSKEPGQQFGERVAVLGIDFRVVNVVGGFAVDDPIHNGSNEPGQQRGTLNVLEITLAVVVLGISVDTVCVVVKDGEINFLVVVDFTHRRSSEPGQQTGARVEL